MIGGEFGFMSHELKKSKSGEEYLEIKNVAEEVYAFSTTADNYFVEIDDMFELQYVVLLMIVNPTKKIFVKGSNRSEITDTFYKVSELMRFLYPEYVGRFFVETSDQNYGECFNDINMKNMGDVAPIIPIYSNSNYLFRDFCDLDGENDGFFSRESNNRFYQLVKLICKKLGFNYTTELNLDNVSKEFVDKNLACGESDECLSTWRLFFSECDVLDLLIFSYVMDSILKGKNKRDRKSSTEVERIFWVCKNYSNGLLQLIENSILHSQTANKREAPSLLLLRINKKILRVELTDLAQNLDNIDNGYIVSVFKNNLEKYFTNNLQYVPSVDLGELKNADITLSDVFKIKSGGVLQKYTAAPVVVARHYGLITFEHSVSALGGFFQVQSGRGPNNYFSNIDDIKDPLRTSEENDGHIYTDFFIIDNSDTVLDIGLPYSIGTHYETLLPVDLFRDLDSGNQWKFLSTNMDEESFCECKVRQIIKCESILKAIGIVPESEFIKNKNIYVHRAVLAMGKLINPNGNKTIEIDFSDIGQNNHVFRKFRIEVIIKALIELFMERGYEVFLSNMTKPDLFIACQLLIEVFAVKRRPDYSFFLCDNSYDNFVLLKKDVSSIKGSIYKQCSNGALDVFAYRFFEAAARGTEQ